MKTRYLSFFLVLVLISTLIIPVAAVAVESDKVSAEVKEENKIQIVNTPIKSGWIMESVGHGEFIIIDSDNITMRRMANVSTNVKQGEYISVVPTSDSEIFQTADGKYLVRATENSYLLSDKIAVNTNNIENYKPVFEKFNISQKSILEMEEVIASQVAMGNDEISIDIYVPSENLTNEIMPLRGETNTSYYTYKDKTGYTWKMRDISTKYSNLRSPWIEKKGEKTKDIATSIRDITISALGGISKVAKLATAAGLATSIYGLYKNLRGEVVECTGEDYLSVSIIFDRIEKDSQSYITGTTNGYMPGKVTHKVWVNRLD